MLGIIMSIRWKFNEEHWDLKITTNMILHIMGIIFAAKWCTRITLVPIWGIRITLALIWCQKNIAFCIQKYTHNLTFFTGRNTSTYTFHKDQTKPLKKMENHAQILHSWQFQITRDKVSPYFHPHRIHLNTKLFSYELFTRSKHLQPSNITIATSSHTKLNCKVIPNPIPTTKLLQLHEILWLRSTAIAPLHPISCIKFYRSKIRQNCRGFLKMLPDPGRIM